MNLLCFWILCLVPVGSNAILDCMPNTLGHGTPQELAKVVPKLTNAGVMLNAECKEPQEKFAVDWIAKGMVRKHD